MSSAGKSEIPSNEEVVDELTKDLQSSAIEPEGSAGESEPETETREREEEERETRDADYVDDEWLKERDDKLSDEEKRVSLTDRCLNA